MVARNRTWIRQVSSLFLHNGGNVVVFAVGAVYDRAFGPPAYESCAVYDRAYSKKDDVTSRCVKPFALTEM